MASIVMAVCTTFSVEDLSCQLCELCVCVCVCTATLTCVCIIIYVT